MRVFSFVKSWEHLPYWMHLGRWQHSQSWQHLPSWVPKIGHFLHHVSQKCGDNIAFSMVFSHFAWLGQGGVISIFGWRIGGYDSDHFDPNNRQFWPRIRSEKWCNRNWRQNWLYGLRCRKFGHFLHNFSQKVWKNIAFSMVFRNLCGHKSWLVLSIGFRQLHWQLVY